MNGTSAAIVAIATLFLNGGALIAFWVWARSQLVKVSEVTAATAAQVAAIERRCAERKDWLEGMNKAVNATARNVVRLAQAQGVEVEAPE